METGTYEVIKERLSGQGQSLRERVEQLNVERKKVFGSVETKLLSSERILTENNCVPRDMAPIGDFFLFGYNVHIGLKNAPSLEDVFSIYKFTGSGFEQQSLSLIDDKLFKKDFDDLYQYYKGTFFAKFTILGPYLYMIFQTGKNPSDFKVFKWLVEEGGLTYVDNRSESEIRFNKVTDFDFVRATRDDQRSGIHPHVSIHDKVFVETIGGDLTIKVEDNTDTGKGIYSEPVVDSDQTLDDAEVHYVDLGQMILLKILPYKEEAYRYFIYNSKLKNVVRIDSIKDTCMRLPGDHGLIFPTGYYLQNGEYKVFDVPGDDAVFDEMNSSSNGEDYQYIFYNAAMGIYLMYSYNVIEQSIDTPIVCSGYSHFKNGEMIVFRQEEEPRKNHTIQVWQTPYVGKDYVVKSDSDSILLKIGNKDIVDCMAGCRVIDKLIAKGESYQSVYMDIVKEAQLLLDSYFWIDKKEAFNLAEVLKEIKETATFAIGEFEKVVRIKKATKKQFDEVSEKTESLLNNLTYGTFETVSDYVTALSEIRLLRGAIVSLNDLMYTDTEVVASLDEKVKEQNEAFSDKCVKFLIEPEGLKPYELRVRELQENIESVSKSSEGVELSEGMEKTSEDLELLMDIVSNFKIDDPTVTTAIIEKISALFSLLNNAKAKLKSKIEAFNKSEMSIQFSAQMKLLSQAVVNYLDISDTEDKCDQYLNKVMVQLQELEGKFSEFDEYIIKLDEKREEIYSAFESKKQAILDKLNKRLVALFDSSERIISGIGSRLKAFDSVEGINGYLATDIMAEKVRDIIAELRNLGDNVKADEISSKLKALRENTIRQLKDKQELYVDGEDVIKFGKHHFSVNRKAIDLSIVRKEEDLYYHITGTDFWDKVTMEGLEKYRYVYEQTLVSENRFVYRGEYLAYQVFMAATSGDLDTIDELYNMSEQQLGDVVRKFMEPRYQEGYTKGVHDSDGAKILKALLELHQSIDLLIFGSDVRAMARLYWECFADDTQKKLLESRLKHLTKVSKHFSKEPDLSSYLPNVIKDMTESLSGYSFIDMAKVEEAAGYLCRELMIPESFVISLEANQLFEGFKVYLRDNKALDDFNASIKEGKSDLEGTYYLISEWLNAYLTATGFASEAFPHLANKAVVGIKEEVIVLLINESIDNGRVINVPSRIEVTGLVGSHDLIEDGTYILAYTSFMNRLKDFATKTAVDFEKLQDIKKDLIADFKSNLRLDDFKPNVLTSFVRNQLIDKVYLPLIGDNLAKQMGTVGDNKRTDLMGLLLLVSPPGYGKTTLMEYIASRLGIILVKVNGPSLGHDVTSLDPAKADHSSAKEELRKLNLALKMGNNVMIYVDDIQHCNPEFLQKFISLCDGQRKIEGVYNGVGQSYDLRGKKVAVVMAGNPYTESGEKFKIPDMLANRADVYNLGDMLRENEEAFKLSYIENSLTSNPVLSKLSNRSQTDLYGLIKIAKGAERESVEFESSYSADEFKEYVDVIQKLFTVRDVVLKVNMAYIHSAAQSDEYRSEPPFKLQGSYRNMNKIAERVVSVMNDEELFGQIQASYENDCQTLTSGAESNILQWKELVGVIEEADASRLDEIRQIFVKSKLVRGDDKLGQAVVALTDLNDNIGQIRELLDK